MHPMNRRTMAEWLPAAVRGGLEIAFVLLLAVQGARLTWLMVEPAEPIGTPSAQPQSRFDRDLAVLRNFNPFAPRGPAVSTATEDPGSLLLHGVRVSSGGTGSAIISVDGKQSVYWVGEEIAPGAVLKEVAGDHAVIASGERTSRLALAARAATPNSAAVVPSYMIAQRPPAPAKTPTVTGVDTKKLLAEAGLLPRTQDGRVTGYTLLPRGAGEMLGRAGLAAGDVLVALNGNRLTPERYSELEQQLTGASQVQLTIERGNETKTITLQTER